MAHHVALLVVVGRAPFPDLARSFVAARARIERFVAKHSPPWIAKVYRPPADELARNPLAAGRVEHWYP